MLFFNYLSVHIQGPRHLRQVKEMSHIHLSSIHYCQLFQSSRSFKRHSQAFPFSIVITRVVYLGYVGLGGQANHDVQFLQLHIDGVVVFHKEHLDLLLQDLRPGERSHHTLDQ